MYGDSDDPLMLGRLFGSISTRKVLVLVVSLKKRNCKGLACFLSQLSEGWAVMNLSGLKFFLGFVDDNIDLYL